MRLESASFREGEPIPREHSRDGGDSHPALSWSDSPPGTATFALVCEDPDAPRGTWIHWVLYDVPVAVMGVPAAVSKAGKHPSGGTQGKNSYGELGWGGPAPPRGHGPHRYVFHLYALDSKLGLPSGLSRADLDAAMRGHVLGEVKLTGIYRRD